VLFIYGKHDITCLEYLLKLMKFLASVGMINAQFKEIDAWHWITHEQPEEVNTLTLDFLEGLVGAK
jgi:pimeloyl-ACP methyl ester carboxylesterase